MTFSVIRFIGSSVAELVALRPVGALAQRLLLDDLLVVLDALAVERRGEQLAAGAVLSPSSAKTEPGPKILLRLGLTLIRSSVLAMNTCRISAGSETTTVRPKNGTLSGEHAAVALRTRCCNIQRRKPAKADALDRLRQRAARADVLPGWSVEGLAR